MLLYEDLFIYSVCVIFLFVIFRPNRHYGTCKFDFLLQYVLNVYHPYQWQIRDELNDYAYTHIVYCRYYHIVTIK